MAIVLLILVSSPLIFPPNISEIPYSKTEEGGNYVLLGRFTFDNMSRIDRLFRTVTKYLANEYSKYFHAKIIDAIPDHHVHTLVVIAHGSNNGTHIFLQLNRSRYRHNYIDAVTPLNDMPADQVIYAGSCSIGIIRQLDHDTDHYAYSIKNELDTVDASLIYNLNGRLIDVNIRGWGQYFLDFIRAGMPWSQAEIQARNFVNNNTVPGSL